MQAERSQNNHGLFFRGLMGIIACVLLIPASADNLDKRIEAAQELNVIDPTGSGWQLLQELEDESENATSRQRAEIELIMIRTLALQGEHERALERALALSEVSLDEEHRLSVLRLGANVAMNTGRFDVALSQLNEALARLDQNSSSKNKVGVFGLASYFHTQAGDTLLAVDYAEQALDSARLSADTRLQCVALSWLSHAQAAHENHKLAREISLESIELCERVGDDVTIAWTANLLARLAIDAGNIDEANEWVARASELSQGTFRDGQIESDLIKARLLLINGELERALNSYRALIGRLSEGFRFDSLAEALDGAAESSTRLGDLKAAVDFHKRHVEVRGQHLERSRSLSMAQHFMQFERDRKQKEILLLQEQQRLKELIEKTRAQRKKLITSAWIVGFFLAVFLVVWLVQALRERRHFRKLSDRDGLTQLFNHTRFFKQLELELNQEHEHPLVLIMADIDDFKLVNDRFGHQIGDEVLRHTARLLKDVYGDERLIGRVGGEEFAICLLDTSEQQAREQIQSLIDRLSGHKRKPTDPPITLSFGVGVAQDGETLESLRQRTDSALYRAKRQGRNRAVLAKAP